MEVRNAEGEPLDLGGPRPRSVLALLLADPGRMVATDRLIDEVYGDDAPAGAANALQSQISRLRRRLGVRIESLPTGYRLDVNPDDVDAHRFERLAHQGRQALAVGDHARAAALLREALGLWRGPAQVQEDYAARLEEQRLAAAEDRFDAELALGENSSLVPELLQLVAAHPLRERLCGQLMRALHSSGRQAEALAVYEKTRTTLAEELGTDPSAELSGIHLALLRSDRPAAEATPRAVPAQFTSFVGRDSELGRIGALLSSARLVTLIGPGGVGKTRLAVEAASRATTAVCFVELAPLTDGAQIPAAVLGALGLRPSSGGGPGPQERLVTALAEQRLLLVLDNCEHVVEDTARLVRRLLGQCPGVRVLATGREALGLTGEALCPLSPLEPASAVRLFGDRAMAVSPGFVAEGGRAAVVERICTALDGLPLALELAAARLRTLSVEEVAARLDDRFKLLSRGDRTAEPRHQTLRAVVEWSWELLDDDERALARRLTVFSGGATLAAAEAVCGLPDTEELLDSLVGKSLVESREGRLRMFETVRAFCAERLADSGEEEHYRANHARYFLTLAETAEAYLRRTEQVEWLARLAAEQGNLQTALRWSVSADATLALRLVAELTWYWWLRGLHGETAPLAAALLTEIDDEPPTGLDEEYILCVLNAYMGQGDSPDAESRLDRVEAVLMGIDRPLRRPILTVLWATASGPGRANDVTRRKQIGTDRWSRAVSRMGGGFEPWFAGRPDEAEAQFATALAEFRATGDRWGMANSLDPLAMFAGWRGDHALALARLDEALTMVGQLDAPEETADLLRRRADTLLHGGDLEQAQTHYERAAELARRIGIPDKLAAAQRGLGDLARLAGSPGGARHWYERALASVADNWTSVAEMQLLFTGLGRTAEAEGQPQEARSWHEQALAIAMERRTPVELADAAEGLAGLAVLESAGERAALLMGAGVALRGTAVAKDPDASRIAAAARALIGDDAYAEAHARGLALTHEEALTALGQGRSADGA
ncbi:BTAD domain-containing putative transcriptional regulator [Streptomyces agglomeratus]|uniref:BTAD domain-containing putative transcriptional regulator n=1 Tax=Streptomyces agglomeratus TaxID=285458 RepID=UPI001FD16D08|nr:BTAD domain-containing putative transcriptional regulator [Streptomyces agglomeratus]